MSLPHSIHVSTHPLVQHKLSKMRDKLTSSTNFRRLLREIGLLLGYDATRDLPRVTGRIETRLAPMDALLLEGKKLVVVPILRAGLGLAEGIVDLVPLARMGHICIYRDPGTLQAVEYYFRIPGDISDRDVIVCDPMLATGHSAIAAVDQLKERGARRLKVVCVLGSYEVVRACAVVLPDVPVHAAAVAPPRCPRIASLWLPCFCRAVSCQGVSSALAIRRFPTPSCPALCRASTPSRSGKSVDGRVKPGHDGKTIRRVKKCPRKS